MNFVKIDDLENLRAAVGEEPSAASNPPFVFLIHDTPPVGMYVLNMFRMRGSRLWGSRLHCVVHEAFREAFGTEEQCRTALVRLRWPDGFVCPCCGHREHCVLAGRGLYQCT